MTGADSLQTELITALYLQFVLLVSIFACNPHGYLHKQRHADIYSGVSFSELPTIVCLFCFFSSPGELLLQIFRFPRGWLTSLTHWGKINFVCLWVKGVIWFRPVQQRWFRKSSSSVYLKFGFSVPIFCPSQSQIWVPNLLLTLVRTCMRTC